MRYYKQQLPRAKGLIEHKRTNFYRSLISQANGTTKLRLPSTMAGHRFFDSFSSTGSGTSDLAYEDDEMRRNAKEMYHQLYRAERNPSMSSRRSSVTGGTAPRRNSLYRRASLQNTTIVMNIRRASCCGSVTSNSSTVPTNPDKPQRKARRRVIKNVKFPVDEHLEELEYIESFVDMETALIDAIWFSRDELDDYKAEADQLAEALEHEANLEGHVDHEDWRGLENRTEEGNWKAYKARSDVTNAVLDAQDELQAPHNRRRLSTTDGAFFLAEASLEISISLVEEALERARQDALAAQQYCQDVPRCQIGMSQ